MGPTVDFHIASAAILALVLLYTMFGRRMRHGRQFKLFLAFYVSSALAVVFGSVCIAFAQCGPLCPCVMPLGMAVLVLQCASCMLMFVYTASLCRGDLKMRLERTFALSIPFVLAVAVVLSNPVTEAVLAVDGVGRISPGSLYAAVNSCMAFYPVMCIVCAVAYRKMLKTLDAAAVWCASIAVFVCIVAEMALDSLHPISFGLAIAVLSVFVTAGSPFEFVDSLTHAFDIAAFRARMDDLLKGKRRFSVVIVSLRHLDTLNALLGSSVGDEAIRQCARASMQAGRTRQVYRVRGSAFALVTFSRRECHRVVNDLTALFSAPQLLGASSVDLDVAVAYSSNLEAFDSTEDIVQYIDFLIERLQAGDDVPEEQQGLVEAFTRRREVRRYLAYAVKNDLVETYAQPLYSFEEEGYSSLEILSRLNHPKLGAIPPDEFIEAAESEGLIAQMGRMQFEAVCDFVSGNAMELEKAGIHSVKINLSPLELVEAGFGDGIVKTMESWQVDPAFFQFEITETAAIRFGGEVENTVRALCEAGSGLCMDDFGSGFANFDAVLSLPFSIVKIDKALLSAASRDASAAELYRSVVSMMKQQGFSTVAEGVETAEQDAFARELAVDEAQGYFYAKPMPIDEILVKIN